MLKVVLLAFCFCFPIVSHSQSQEVFYTFKVENDDLHLKWFPFNGEIFKHFLTFSTEISWIEVDKNMQLEQVDFTSSRKIVVRPFAQQMDSLYARDTNLLVMADVFLKDPVLDKDLQQMNYVNALVQNFFDKKVTTAIGNYLLIENYNPKKNIAFRIKNKGFQKDFSFIVDPKSYQIKKIEVLAFIDQRKVNINWDVKELNLDFCAYNIYRKTDEDKNFVKQNNLPIVPFESSDEVNPTLKRFIDKKIKKGTRYQYQIKALDYFGDETGKSDIKTIYVPLSVDAIVEITNIRAKEKDRLIDVSITPTDSIEKPSINRLLLFRSDSVLNGFKEIQVFNVNQPLVEHHFNLTNYISGDRFYYKVAAISKDNDTSFSAPYYFFTYDQVPPGPAIELRGQIDTAGIVTLSWLAPTDDDIKGYRVFRSNSKNGEYIELTKRLKKNTIYKDTLRLNTLTNEVFYCVRTVDNNFNNSPNSEIIVLYKPDTIPPMSGVIKDLEISEKGVQLKWSNSYDEQLYKQVLLRKNNLSTKFDTLFVWKDNTSSYVDSNVSSGNQYEYQLVAFDQSLNAGKSKSQVVNYELGYRDAIKTIEIVVNREKKSINLNWVYDNNGVYSYQIYKAKEGQNFQLYKTLIVNEGFVNSFEDKDLKINTVFKYKIKATLNSGISTKMSREFSVGY